MKNDGQTLEMENSANNIRLDENGVCTFVPLSYLQTTSKIYNMPTGYRAYARGNPHAGWDYDNGPTLTTPSGTKSVTVKIVMYTKHVGDGWVAKAWINVNGKYHRVLYKSGKGGGSYTASKTFNVSSDRARIFVRGGAYSRGDDRYAKADVRITGGSILTDHNERISAGEVQHIAVGKGK